MCITSDNCILYYSHAQQNKKTPKIFHFCYFCEFLVLKYKYDPTYRISPIKHTWMQTTLLQLLYIAARTVR